MYRLFPSRLAVPAVSQNPEMQALYDTRNRTERILFARKNAPKAIRLMISRFFILP